MWRIKLNTAPPGGKKVDKSGSPVFVWKVDTNNVELYLVPNSVLVTGLV